MISLPYDEVWILNALLAICSMALAVWLRPWRAVRPEGPPWPWVFVGAAMPWFWGLDLHAGVPVTLPMSVAPFMVLLCGWPLTVLALVPVAALTAVASDIGMADALNRLVWLGLVPATAALAIGGATRRWLPHHLIVYILARAWFGTFLACAAAAWLRGWLHHLPSDVVPADFVVASLLNASGEAVLTGALAAALVAFRPRMLASYADWLYLPGSTPRVGATSSPSAPETEVPRREGRRVRKA